MSYGSKQTLLWSVFLSVVALSGCATNPPAVPDEKSTVNFDKRLLADCQKIPKLEGSSDVQIKSHYEKLLKQYGECATMKRNLNAEVKKALNVKAE